MRARRRQFCWWASSEGCKFLSAICTNSRGHLGGPLYNRCAKPSSPTVEAGGAQAQFGTGSFRRPLQPLGPGGATCEVALHATTPRLRTPEVSYCRLGGCHPFLERKCQTWGRVHRLRDSTRSVERPSLWPTWFTFDGSDDADPLRLADKLGQLDAQVGELQRDGIASPTVPVEVECFLTGDWKGMCARHTKLKCRCWHCDLAFQEFGGDNLRPSDFVISIRWRASSPLRTPNTSCWRHCTWLL